MSSLARFGTSKPDLPEIQFPTAAAATVPKLKVVIETYKLNSSFEHMDIFDWLSSH